ncbi:MAG: Gfo/Idh/MocA family protein [Cellulosilyticaceae bacterium]
MKQIVTVAIVGLGSRGIDVYAPGIKRLGEKVKIVAVADIDAARVQEAAKQYQLTADACFESAEALLEEERLADVIIIATQDQQHVAQAVVALKKGYHILLEKPISPDLEACQLLERVAQACNRHVVVCHVLRYTPFYTKLKAILDEKVIGEVVSTMAIENVGYWHQAHSFVRGNWRNSLQTSPMILQKCCHDMDLYLWLTSKCCKAVSSFGNTYLFKKEMAPAGATQRCTEGCAVKASCPYDAEAIYIHHKAMGLESGNTGWPINVVAPHPTLESVRKALDEGPYGRCVYACDNNVVDHQVVNLEMTDGTTMSFTMSGFTSENSRYAKIMGTKGDIEADMEKNLIRLNVFGQPKEVIDINQLAEDFSGHGGGDNRMIAEFIELVREGKMPTPAITSIEQSLQSHYIALAAERSRLNGGACIQL